MRSRKTRKRRGERINEKEGKEREKEGKVQVNETRNSKEILSKQLTANRIEHYYARQDYTKQV